MTPNESLSMTRVVDFEFNGLIGNSANSLTSAHSSAAALHHFDLVDPRFSYGKRPVCPIYRLGPMAQRVFASLRLEPKLASMSRCLARWQDDPKVLERELQE